MSEFDKEHPAVAVAPKNLREAMERLLAWCENGKPRGLYRYCDKHGNLCAIGQFFTPAQIEDIKVRRANSKDILFLTQKIGVANLEFMTGMTQEQAIVIQAMSDIRGKEALARFVRDTLINGSNTGTIMNRTATFNLLQ